MQNAKNNNSQNFGQQFHKAYLNNSYKTITDIAKMVHSKRMKNIALGEQEDKFIKDEFKKIEKHVFRQAMYMIQEDVLNSVFEKEVLAIAAEYAKKCFSGKNFDLLLETEEIIKAVFSKLTPEETKNLQKYSKTLTMITPENCNKILEVSEDNAAVTIPERMALKKLLERIGWFKPTKKEEKPAAKVVSINSVAAAEKASTNGEEKKEKVAS